MGVKSGRMKGNKQKAQYEEPGETARETRLERTGKSQRSESRKGSTEEATVRRKREERGKEETEAE